jgi:hypothetical protein
MARKRSREVKENIEEVKKQNIAPLHAKEGQLLQNFANLATNYDKLLKQQQQYKFVVKSMYDTRKKIQDGEITALHITVAPGTTAPLTNKKEMIEYIDDQIKTMNQALLGINGQVEHKKDLFIESGLHLRSWCDSRFGKYKPSEVTGFRGGKAKAIEADEKVLFEQAFEDLDEEAFKKAKDKAIELNKEKAKKE